MSGRSLWPATGLLGLRIDDGRGPAAANAVAALGKHLPSNPQLAGQKQKGNAYLRLAAAGRAKTKGNAYPRRSAACRGGPHLPR